MKPFRVPFLCCALAGLLGAAEPAAAAWNNVFQVTCLFGRRRETVASYYAAPVVVQSSPVVASAPVVASSSPCCDPCPQQCTTSYVQRCYYQPVTTYQTQSYYQQVTSYRTSYYYEPVTSYTYSSYYDPCTCSCQQVAVPTTSYRLRSQCCPVTSWVQRCAQVPVTSYQRVSYWEPQTSCCSPCSSAVVTPAPAVAAPAVTNPPVTTSPPPVVNENPTTAPPPSVNESQTPNTLPQTQYQYYGGPKSNTQSYQPPLTNQSAPSGASQSPPPQVRLNRIVSETRRDDAGRLVQGQIVHGDSAPRGHARLVFVNADRRDAERVATANEQGRFNVALAAGRWSVYIDQADGPRTYHSRIDVQDGESTPFITLVSR